jgi:hypothetical protein
MTSMALDLSTASTASARTRHATDVGDVSGGVDRSGIEDVERCSASSTEDEEAEESLATSSGDFESASGMQCSAANLQRKGKTGLNSDVKVH